MNSGKRIILLLAAALVCLVALAVAGAAAPAPERPLGEIALAYVDPGSAGFIIVSVLGFLSAIGYAIRSRFSRFKDWLFRRPRSAQEDAAAHAEESAQGRMDDDPPPPARG